MPIILGIFSQPIVYPLQQLAGIVDGFPTEFDLLTGERPMAILRLQALPYRLFKLPLDETDPKYGFSENQRQTPGGSSKRPVGSRPGGSGGGFGCGAVRALRSVHAPHRVGLVGRRPQGFEFRRGGYRTAACCG